MAVRGTVDSGAGGTLVTSVTGTANQIDVAPTTGAVVVSLDPVAQIATSLAIGGATIGANALAVTGTSTYSGTITTTSGASVVANGSLSAGQDISSSYAPVVSRSALTLSGTPNASGTGTTTFPLMYLNTTGSTQPTTLNTGGTFLGINAPSGYNGYFLDFRKNGGASLFNADAFGNFTAGASFTSTAGATALSATNYSLTSASASSLVNLAGTLNTSGSPDVIKLAITNTAAGASAKLLNLYAGASGTTSMFSVDLTGKFQAAGALIFSTAASGVTLKQGANGLCGTFIANGATPVVISNTNIAITDSIIISLNTIGGTVGVQPHVSAITASTSFAVTCTATDTSTYNYAIIKNAA